MAQNNCHKPFPSTLKSSIITLPLFGMNPHTSWLLTNLAASVLLPPFNLLILGAVGFLLLKRKPKLGKSLIAASLVLLYTLSTPVVADYLLGLLEKNILPLGGKNPPHADAIVILGGGTYRDAPEYGADTVKPLTLERLRYGAWLHKLTGKPILVTGGAPLGGTPEGMVMRAVLVNEFKTPVRWVEARSFNTEENAAFSAAILKREGINRVYVVSQPWHLPRALGAFRDAGLTPIAAGTHFHRWQRFTLFSFLPSAAALNDSYYALHEGIGLLWYRLRYWKTS